jgi:nitrile hydratase beta subunit
MNGIHDLGGIDGFGAVIAESDEPVFHAEWEKAVLAMVPASFAAGYFNMDQFRYGIEQMHPAHYLSSRYYERWLHAIEHHAVRTGALDPAEIEQRTSYFSAHPDAPLPVRHNPKLTRFIDKVCANGRSARREPAAPAAYAVGDRVRITDDHPYGHTRRPRYIRGRSGLIHRVRGCFPYPDTSANGEKATPEWVYTVRFEATELWGDEAADPKGSVHIDVWEPYVSQQSKPRRRVCSK